MRIRFLLEHTISRQKRTGSFLHRTLFSPQLNLWLSLSLTVSAPRKNWLQKHSSRTAVPYQRARFHCSYVMSTGFYLPDPSTDAALELAKDLCIARIRLHLHLAVSDIGQSATLHSGHARRFCPAISNSPLLSNGYYSISSPWVP